MDSRGWKHPFIEISLSIDGKGISSSGDDLGIYKVRTMARRTISNLNLMSWGGLLSQSSRWLKSLCNYRSAEPIKPFKISVLRKSYLPVSCGFKNISSRAYTICLSDRPSRKAASALGYRWFGGGVIILVVCKGAFRDVVFIQYANELQAPGGTKKNTESLFRFYFSHCAARCAEKNKDNDDVVVGKKLAEKETHA